MRFTPRKVKSISAWEKICERENIDTSILWCVLMSVDEIPNSAGNRKSNPCIKSDQAWFIKGYDSWKFNLDINLPLYESKQVDGMFADPPMTGPLANASKILNDSPANRFNGLVSYQLRHHCSRLSDSQRCTIIATSSTMLVTMRTEIRMSKQWVYRFRRTTRWFYVKQSAHHRHNHVCVSLLP